MQIRSFDCLCYGSTEEEHHCLRVQPRQSTTTAATANRSLLVPVTPECGARRGHRGRVCDPSDRGDRDQRDQRKTSDDECPHDTSPCCGTLSTPPGQGNNLTLVACNGPILGHCFPPRRCLPHSGSARH